METSIRRGLPRAVVDDVFLAPVHINAGGTHYTTTLDTLTRYPESKLAKLFDGTLPIPIDPISRQYFLDINGSVFVHVLDFLRYGELLLPEGFTQLPLLTKLADYFEIQGLTRQRFSMLTKDDWIKKCENVKKCETSFLSSQALLDDDAFVINLGIKSSEDEDSDQELAP